MQNVFRTAANSTEWTGEECGTNINETGPLATEMNISISLFV